MLADHAQALHMLKQTEAGCVRWPVDVPDWTDSGEGGMWVTAYWLADFESVVESKGRTWDGIEFTVPRDPFIKCHGPDSTIGLPVPEWVTSPNYAQVYEVTDPEDDPHTIDVNPYSAGRGVLAAAVLATTRASYVNSDGKHWHAEVADLTVLGQKIIQVISLNYLRTPVLVTYLDT